MSDEPTGHDRDERVTLAPLDPEEALRGLLAVDPDSEPAGLRQSNHDEDDEPPLSD